MQENSKQTFISQLITVFGGVPIKVQCSNLGNFTESSNEQIQWFSELKTT